MVLIALILIVAAMLAFFYKRKRDQEKLLEHIVPKLNYESLMESMRKISFENQMDSGAQITLTLIESGKEVDVQQHFLPARDSGSIPFFVIGVLRVDCGDKTVLVDISDKSKEYIVTIIPDGSMKSSAQEMQD